MCLTPIFAAAYYEASGKSQISTSASDGHGNVRQSHSIGYIKKTFSMAIREINTLIIRNSAKCAYSIFEKMVQNKES